MPGSAAAAIALKRKRNEAKKKDKEGAAAGPRSPANIDEGSRACNHDSMTNLKVREQADHTIIY